MPGIEDTGNRAVVVPNQPLVTSASAVVEPIAVNALVDSFHKGVITADDIAQRIGEVGHAKRKAEVAAYETTAKLAPVAERAQRAKLIRETQSDETLGESEKTAAAFQIANEPVPRTPEGFVDIPTARAKRDEINQWAAEVNSAKIRLAGVKTEKREMPDGSKVLGHFSETDGRFLTNEEYGQLMLQQNKTFRDWKAERQPAAPTTAPGVEGLPPGVVPVGVGAFVQPKAAPAKQSVLPAPGKSVAGILDNQVEGPPKHPVPSEGVQKLQLGALTERLAQKLQTDYEALIASDSEYTGIIAGTLANVAAAKRWKQSVAALEQDVTALLAPVAKGIFNETGVLSDKDIERYKSVLPDLRDNPKVGHQKLIALLNTIAQARQIQIDTWKQLGYDVSGLQPPGMIPQPAASATATATAAQPGKRLTIPGIGAGTIGPDGIFRPE